MDTGKIRENQNQELSQLNLDYQKRKEKLVSQREAELNDIKKQYQEKESTLRQNTDAAITHIRKESRDVIEKAEIDSRKSLEATKQSLVNEKQVYEKNLFLQRQLQQDRQKKMASDFDAQRQDAVESQHNDLEQIQKKHFETSSEVQKNYSNQLKQLQDQNVNTLSATQSRGQDQLSEVTKLYQEKLEKLHNDGDRKIDNEKTRQTTVLAELKINDKKERETEHNLHSIQLDQESSSFRNRYQELKNKNQDELQKNDELFAEHFQDRQNEMEKNLRSQDRIFNRELLKQKFDFAEKVIPFESEKEDPFYKLIDRKSDFKETDKAYILKAYIPIYDKKSIHVTVQPDKVSVQGNRSYKDETQDKNKRLTSQQFQSFREEFKFTNPILEKAILQEREGDYITVTIPKLRSNDQC